MTLAYTGIMIPPPSTVKSQEDAVKADETQNSSSPDQDHGGAVIITQPQPILNAAQSSHIPTAKPRFGGYRDRFGAGQIGHNHSKRVIFFDKPPRHRSPAIAPSRMYCRVIATYWSASSYICRTAALRTSAAGWNCRMRSSIDRSTQPSGRAAPFTPLSLAFSVPPPKAAARPG